MRIRGFMWYTYIVLWMVLIFLVMFMVGLGGRGPLLPLANAIIIRIQGPWSKGFLVFILTLGGLAWLFIGLPAMLGGSSSGSKGTTYKVTKQGRGSYTVKKK